MFLHARGLIDSETPLRQGKTLIGALSGHCKNFANLRCQLYDIYLEVSIQEEGAHWHAEAG